MPTSTTRRRESPTRGRTVRGARRGDREGARQGSRRALRELRGARRGGAGGPLGQAGGAPVMGPAALSIAAAGALVAAVAVAGYLVAGTMPRTDPAGDHADVDRRRSLGGLKATYTKRFGAYSAVADRVPLHRSRGSRSANPRSPSTSRPIQSGQTSSRRGAGGSALQRESALLDDRRAEAGVRRRGAPITAFDLARRETDRCVRLRPEPALLDPGSTKTSPWSRSTEELRSTPGSRTSRPAANFVAAVETPCL